jgi:hypothetical protein
MKRLLIGTLLLVAVLSAGCALLSSQPSEQVQEPTPAPRGSPVKATLALPASTCQSRLDGRITNNASKLPPTNVLVEIASGDKKLQTKTDQNGLYGFAGLCAGQYAVSITPPGGNRKADVSKVSLDGANAAKQDLKY